MTVKRPQTRNDRSNKEQMFTIVSDDDHSSVVTLSAIAPIVDERCFSFLSDCDQPASSKETQMQPSEYNLIPRTEIAVTLEDSETIERDCGMQGDFNEDKGVES